jgi:hypothetical protein
VCGHLHSFLLDHAGCVAITTTTTTTNGSPMHSIQAYQTGTPVFDGQATRWCRLRRQLAPLLLRAWCSVQHATSNMHTNIETQNHTRTYTHTHLSSMSVDRTIGTDSAHDASPNNLSSTGSAARRASSKRMVSCSDIISS